MADTRRLIGIDLAWGKETGTDYDSTDCEGSGCAELVWNGNGLTLERPPELLHSMEDIVKWIEPDRGDWVIAVDVPIVIRNEEGRRPAEDEADEYYRPYDAVPRPSNLNLAVGKSQRGDQLLAQLRKVGGELVESAAHLENQRLVFETYPHIAMVELFGLDRTIKYKASQCQGKGGVLCQQKGQRRLADSMREHLCSDSNKPASDKPKLRSNKKLAELLPEPFPDLGGQKLKDREDKLDGLVCAYTAAWLDAGGDLVGLGKVGEGVMIAPRVQGIGPLLR